MQNILKVLILVQLFFLLLSKEHISTFKTFYVESKLPYLCSAYIQGVPYVFAAFLVVNTMKSGENI